MHLIPRRGMRRVLVLLIAMSGLLAVPALALAHSDLSLVKVVDHAQAAPGDLLTYTILIENHGTHANAPGHRDRHAAGAHHLRERLRRVHRRGRRDHLPGRAARRRRHGLLHGDRARRRRRARGRPRQHRRRRRRRATRPTTNNHGSATSTVGFAGLGDYVWWDQNHDGLQTPASPASPA